jgi:hypothetical protein
MYNSLMRRPSAPEQQPKYGVKWTGQHEIEAACGTACAPVGMLRRPPACDTALIAAFLERMGGEAGDGIDVDVDADASGNRDKAVAGRWV